MPFPVGQVWYTVAHGHLLGVTNVSFAIYVAHSQCQLYLFKLTVVTASDWRPSSGTLAEG